MVNYVIYQQTIRSMNQATNITNLARSHSIIYPSPIPLEPNRILSVRPSSLVHNEGDKRTESDQHNHVGDR
jgi:hypothetical protein